jgi:phage terminase large subunit
MSALLEAASRIRAWREHPAQMVRELFRAEPDPYQEEVLERFPHCQRQAMTACKGPGKTTTLAWLGWNFMLTRVDAKVPALSVTADNLADNLWTELALWQSKAPLLQASFTFNSSRIASRERPDTWWISARAYARTANPHEQANALAGAHGEHVLVLLDEAGGIPRAVLATAEAALAGGGDQHIVMAGNPTNQDSALGQAVINQRHLYHVIEITGDPDDPQRASRVSIEWARQQIEAWGRDNPWVLVNVFGRFPPGGLNTLISPDEVRDAQKRHYTEAQYGLWPKIIGVDVARFGDDESVMFKRQGKVAFPPLRMRNLDSLQGASHVARISNEWGAHSIQIDATGGYGAGWYDQLRAMNFDALGIQFAAKALAEQRFFNKRAEMWWDLCDWIKQGGALPPVPEMVAGLSTVTYSYKGGRILIEEKDQIKARLGRSPDLEDALACTFGFPVAVLPRGVDGYPDLAALIHNSHQHEYDPYERHAKESQHG